MRYSFGAIYSSSVNAIRNCNQYRPRLPRSRRDRRPRRSESVGLSPTSFQQTERIGTSRAPSPTDFGHPLRVRFAEHRIKNRSITELSAFCVILLRNGPLRQNTITQAPKKTFAVIKISIMAAAACRLRMTVTGCQYYFSITNKAGRRGRTGVPETELVEVLGFADVLYTKLTPATYLVTSIFGAVIDRPFLRFIANANGGDYPVGQGLAPAENVKPPPIIISSGAHSP